MPFSWMQGNLSRAASTASASEDGPGPIRRRAGISAGVDGEAAIGALRTPGGHHRRGLSRELSQLLGARPATCRRQLALVGVLVLRRPPRHDHEHLAALVVPEPELADRPLDLTGLSGRSGLPGQAGVKPLCFQELEDARDQALNVELLAVEYDRLAPGGGAQEE